MRITKSWLRGVKLDLQQRIKNLHHMANSELAEMLKKMSPNAVLGTREENIKVILLLSVEEFIPSHLVDF